MKRATAEKPFWEGEEREEGENIIQEILWDYSQADETRRLHLWLSHRDLRREFNSLEDRIKGSLRRRTGWFQRLKILPRF